MDSRQLLSKERLGLGDSVLECARQPDLEPGLIALSEHPAEEGVHRAGSVSGSVSLERRRNIRAHELRLGLGVRSRSSRLHEDDRPHRIREVERRLERDDGARGMADEVRPLDVQSAHESHAVLGVVGHADRPVDPAAGSETGPVVREEAKPLCEDGLAEQRLRPDGRRPPVDQDNRLARPLELVRELEIVDGRSLHLSHFDLLR